MTESSILTATRLNAVIREGVKEEALQAVSHPLWSRMRELGTELWLDTGDMEAASAQWSAEFTALTTNNSLLNKEIQKGIYDEWIPRAVQAVREDRPDISGNELILEIAFALNARHGLRLVERFGGYVSVELHTDLADDVERSVLYGRRYHALCPARFIVKVPLTPAGLIAARRLEENGIPVNFTLGFSARENHLVVSVARPSWVNVFMGRLNAYVAGNKLGDGRLVGERATLASQKTVRELREALGASSRQIGASFRDQEQVALLAGLDVMTIPTKVAAGFVEDGHTSESLSDRTGEAYDPVFAEGVDPQLEGFETLWGITDSFRAVCAELARDLNPASATPDAIVETLERAGEGNIFPRLSSEDLGAIAAEGKLPSRDRWRERVARGETGLDALFTLAGRFAFASDQAALDARIREHLA